MDHLPDHDHAHVPDGHGHTHAHSHADGEYYLEQLLTILVCGALGTVAVVMYANKMLALLLAPEFHVWVLAGGIVLLVLTAIRGAALWVAVGPSPTVAEAHAHGPDCDHTHDHGHTPAGGHHGHDHAPGAMYLKVIPFALPVLMCVMGLPNQSFSKEWVERRLGTVDTIADKALTESANKDVIGFDFNELNAAAYDEAKRAEFEGRRIKVKGQLKKVSQKDYQLFKLKMTCCAADVIPLKARIRSEVVIPESEFKDYDWVTVEGTLQFVELPEKRQFLPVIRIGGDRGLGLIKATPE